MTGPARRRSILVVEDDPALRQTLVTALRRDGYDVVEASDGLAAIHVLEEHEPPADHFCLILLDLMLPVISGVELMSALTEHLAGIPIVALSGSQEQRTRAAIIGATATLAKPFEVKELLALVGQHCSADR
jgi:CheY-like chemotaxis protein